MIPRNAPRPGFTAGQVAVLEMDNYGDSYYAFASAPEENEFEFLVKRRVSPNVTGALFDPHIAKHVVLRNIVGTGFPVEEYKSHDLVFVAMGTGLAPLRSALRHIFPNRNDFGRIFVLYGARHIEDFCFEDEMTSNGGDTAWNCDRLSVSPATAIGTGRQVMFKACLITSCRK